MSRIFINYRRQDSEGYVGRLYDHLKTRFPPSAIFMDVEALTPGVDFIDELEKAVAACEVFLAVIGPQWLNAADEHGARRLDQQNDFVRIEISLALKHHKLVIPVLVGGAKMPSADRLPEDIAALARRSAFELSHRRFTADVEQLVDAIQQALPSQERKAPSSLEVLRRKEAALRDVRDDLVNAVNSPLYRFRIENRYFPVLGEGSADAKIMFIGESPSKLEAERGKPFLGSTGEVLEEMLAAIHLRREDVFLTNLLLDRPPDNREPTEEEMAFYAPFVDRIIAIIQPAVIATLGRFAMRWLLSRLDLPEKNEKISRIHGKLIKARMDYGEIHILPFYHPAIVLHNPSQRDALRGDFQQLKLFI